MLRLFVAIRPPEEAIDALVDTMEAVENARWQSDEQLHLTLRFIGNVDRRQAEDVAGSLAAIRFDPFSVEIAGVGHFERKGHPCALWAGVEASRELLDLQQRVEHACRRAGLAPETRRFAPHITVARLNRSSAEAVSWLRRHENLQSLTFEVNAFSLFESHLSRHGALYRKIAEFSAR